MDQVMDVISVITALLNALAWPLVALFVVPDHIMRWAWKTRRRTAERIVVLMRECPELPVVRLHAHREAREWLAGPLATSSR